MKLARFSAGNLNVGNACEPRQTRFYRVSRKIGEFGGLPKTVNGDMAPEERFGFGSSPAGIDVL